MNTTGAITTIFITAALLCGGTVLPARGATYYVSRSQGSDACDGRSPVRNGRRGPWRTLAKASAVPYAAGDRLLLKRGDTWTEGLTLRGSGTADDPVTVSAYGPGERPRLLGTGAAGSACMTLDRCGGWRIHGLTMAFAQNAVRIVVDSRAQREYAGFDIADCFFHDVANPTFPDPARREGSQHNDLRNMGWVLFVDGFGSPEAVRISRLSVNRCVALWCQGFYIHMGAVRAEDVAFDGNTLAHNSYNSIYQAGAKRFDITRSVLVYGYPWAFHPNGATQVIAGGLEGDAANRNEVSGNEFGWGGDYPGCPDGCAYDFEGATGGVAFRNNLIHDVSGEPILFMGGFRHQDLLFDGNVFRHCVRFSTRWDAYVTVTNSNTGNGVFSNNRFFMQPGKRAFIDKPASFAFTGNEENATGEFAAMPLVTRIARSGSARTYTLACKTPGATIRYTTDGSLPTAGSPRYTDPIRMTRSGALNAKAFREGWNASYVNALVVNMGDREGRGPVVRYLPGEKRDGKAPTATPRQAAVERLADTFTVAFWAAPGAERLSAREANSGVSEVTGQSFALRSVPPAGDNEAGVMVSVGTNGVGVYESAAGYQPCMLNDDAALGGWHHITVVYRQKQPTLYLDGVYEKAGCKSTRTVKPRLRPHLTAGEFKGVIRDVRVYDRVLTDAEIQVLASETPSRR